MDVLLLGTGSADGWPNPFCRCPSCRSAADGRVLRGPTAALVDEVLLLDCGPEAPRAALRAGRSLDRVTDVFLTHDHPDHTAPAALLWRAWAGTRERLRVHGPQAAVDSCRDWVGPDDPVSLQVVGAGDVVATADHVVTVLPAEHGPAWTAVLYAVADNAGRRLLYATDTGPVPPTSVAAIAAAGPYDLVLMEQTFGLHTAHGTDHLDLDTFGAALGALRCAGAVEPSTEVVAVHLGHHNPPEQDLVAALTAVGARPGRDLETVLVGADHARPTAGRVHLVLGGARSGKSSYAEGLLAARDRVTYVATSGPHDDDPEWVRRVAKHRARRPASWRTLETTDLPAVLATAQADDAVLVDCLTLWLTARLDRFGWDKADETVLDGDLDELVSALRTTSARVVLVSNEVGQGVVPATASGRLFRDLLGRVNAVLAEQADQVTLLVAGLPTTLKETT